MPAARKTQGDLIRRKSHLMAAETEQMLCRKVAGKGELRTGKISLPKELKSSVC